MRLPSCSILLLSSAVLLAGKSGGITSGKTYIYTYYDRNGTVIVNNLPPSYARGQGLILKHVGVGRVRLAISKAEMARVIKSPELIALVDEIAQSVGVDPFLARAVIQTESAFNYRARSKAGALGLMQLMPQTALRFGVLDPFDPRQNITGGSKYLKWLSDYYKGDLTKVIAAYNAGEGAVDKYKGVPPYSETRAYVPRVMELFTKRLVQPDPKAKGSMELLKKGRGGFLVDDKTTPAPEDTKVATRTPIPIYQWTDGEGRIQISDQPPPKSIRDVRTYQSQ